jgi:hypothetical protein
MAFKLHRTSFPGIAASAIAAGQPVTLASGGDRHVAPIATANVQPLGVALASAVNPGEGVAVLDRGNTEIVIAAASLGRGAEIGVLAGTTSFGPVSAASGSAVFSVGQSVSAAAAGEEFSLYINPRQLSGLV